MKTPKDKRTMAQLECMARAEVERLWRAFPTALAGKARAVPVIFEPLPGPDLLRDGYEPDILGLFVGNAFPDERDGNDPLPPTIFLFFENIWNFAGQHDPTYREEVRTTYLHEIGHYLGLDEEDLDIRGLE